jgi:GNAT superfamily N-acetyltransferase
MLRALRYGLVIQRVIERLRLVGINLDPYYLLREGVRQPEQTDWPALVAEFPCSVLDPGDLAAVAECTRWATVEQLQLRLDKGHLCVVLKHRGRIAGYAWADLVEVNDSVCDYPLGPGDAYLYDAFVVPEFRGRDLATYMRVESYKYLRRLGRHTYYSITECFNTPSLKFKKKLNVEILRVYLHVKIGRREIGQWLLRDYERGRAKPTRESR